MDLASPLQQHLVFHLTGQRSGAGLDAVEPGALRPALFARFHDLTRLRYDFPLVLVAGEAEDEFVRTLSGVVDALLQEIVPAGIDGERLRKNVLRLEREVRVLLRDGASGTLGSLWTEATARLVARGGEPVDSDLARARAALRTDGDVLDCDGTMPARLVAHAWRAVQDRKARRMRGEIEALIIRLSDLVKADHLRSEAGRHAETLAAGIGSPHRSLFDFDAMARLLAKPSGASALPESRRRRIEAALAVLRGQRFFAAAGGHAFRFDRAEAAIAAFRERLPEMAALVRAMAIAELELQGRYDEARHDPLFAAYDASSLRPEDRALFPDYLVCETAGAAGGAARARLIDALSSGVPLKILVETADLLDDSGAGDGHVSFGAQLGGSAMGLGEVFVLQSAASNLYRVRRKLLAAMAAPGAALVSVYSAAGARAGGPAPYLVAAAAMQSRAFPTFCYDPGAGADWATRFSLEANPQPDRVWPLHEFAYADVALKRVAETLPFTLADFAACEPRCARHFARVARESWNGSMMPVGDWLARPPEPAPDTVPCIHAIDADGRLQKLIVDEKLVHAARRCADAWRRLQELAALGRERAPAPAAAAPAGEPAAAQEKPAPPAAAEEPPQKPREPGDPYIETERCSSCNECTNLNSAMFAYNENQQAYIKNPDAGTFRELVEAAESCQVAVIHPGKPRNPKEEGLEELLERAAAFQ